MRGSAVRVGQTAINIERVRLGCTPLTLGHPGHSRLWVPASPTWQAQGDNARELADEATSGCGDACGVGPHPHAPRYLL